uniref:Thioredoxin domain-containing protein n=1 Tax=Dunaliella tertiolecta TaxID=3047 RepID=A0A7S3VTF6_DUNTE|mmetsp:Transcript_7837/g.20873  ORF Transcript_7837/g.20873 Transcript_7837/m.20873 type:complete len:232 (+) Transcript_7837:71-766(+)
MIKMKLSQLSGQGHAQRSLQTCCWDRRAWSGNCGRRLGNNRAEKRTVLSRAIHINRRAALDSAWDRQQQRDSEHEELLDSLQQNNGLIGHVIEVEDLDHLETISNAAGSRLCVLFLHSKACGTCKSVAKEFEEMCKQQAAEGAQHSPIVFLKHDVFDEYDFPSTLARFHHVKAVPTFLFLADGAVVKRMSMRDVRTLASAPKAWIHHALDWDVKQLRSAIAAAQQQQQQQQ